MITKEQELVRERLELVSFITDLNPQFLNPKLRRLTLDGGFTHPWQYFDALRNYLLLTCFDILGQPDEFKDFRTWLSASSSGDERTAAMAKAQSMNLQDSIKVVHDEYLSIYGVRKSFNRFIKEVLPEPVRSELLHSVMITKADPVSNLGLSNVETENKKIDFLFSIRNSFTHAGIGTGSPAGGIWKNHKKWVDENGQLLVGWEPIRYEIRGGFRYEYAVRDWPNVLVRTIKAVLAPIPITAQPFYAPDD